MGQFHRSRLSIRPSFPLPPAPVLNFIVHSWLMLSKRSDVCLSPRSPEAGEAWDFICDSQIILDYIEGRRSTLLLIFCLPETETRTGKHAQAAVRIPQRSRLLCSCAALIAATSAIAQDGAQPIIIDGVVSKNIKSDTTPTYQVVGVEDAIVVLCATASGSSDCSTLSSSRQIGKTSVVNGKQQILNAKSDNGQLQYGICDAAVDVEGQEVVPIQG